MIDIKNILTYLTPVRIMNEQEFQNMEISIRSYYDTYSNIRPVHKFALKALPHFKKRFIELIKSIKVNFEIVEENTSALSGFSKLILDTNTKYLFFIFSDVKNLSNKNLFYPSIEAMEQDEVLSQIRLGGYPIGDYGIPKNNIHFAINDNGKVYLKMDSVCEFDYIKCTTGDFVWTINLIPERLGKIFALPFWHTVMRTDVAKQFVKSTIPYLKPNDITISSFIKYGHTSDTITKSKLKEKGWPLGFEFLSEYKHGFLNFACYLYMLGRERKSEEQFLKDHCIEVRDEIFVGELNE